MARPVSNRRCVVCGKHYVTVYTLDNQRKAVVLYLCKKDAAPVEALMELTGDLPPDLQVPVPDRGRVPELPTIKKKKPPMPKMVPLLDWTPPPPAPAVEIEDVS